MNDKQRKSVEEVLATPVGERVPDHLTGFKGTAFLDCGMRVPVICPFCNDDGSKCDPCAGEGVILVDPMKVEVNFGEFTPNDSVVAEEKLTYDNPRPD